MRDEATIRRVISEMRVFRDRAYPMKSHPDSVLDAMGAATISGALGTLLWILEEESGPADGSTVRGHSIADLLDKMDRRAIEKAN